ncbi:hypothetical protein ACFWWS_39940, partial [Streptomyces sp. NPDC059083]|uniref:hypothetical protein n=1 Tax=Streptomyces sp. NPDC059083 TaxID=3346721 RepID=UPI0036CA2824
CPCARHIWNIMSNLSRLPVPVAAFAAIAAGTVLAAPQASAHSIGSLTVEPGLVTGFGTGSSYRVSATVDADAERVIFIDNGWQIRGSTLQVSGNTASVRWTPTTTGVHVISAQFTVGDGAQKLTIIGVGTGIDLGSACLVQ